MTVYDLITYHEGRKSTPYKCPAGNNTIGVGWNIDANALPPDIAAHLQKHGRITEDMIDRLLDISVRHAVADCHVLFPEFDHLADIRRMALTDFVFQLGFKRARTFKRMIAAVNSGQWNDAAKEIINSDYYRQLGGDAPGTNDHKQERPETIAEMIRLGDEFPAGLYFRKGEKQC